MRPLKSFHVRPLSDEDRHWTSRFVEERWGSTKVVSRGRVYYPHQLTGFAALQKEKPVGLVTYRIDGSECEVVTIDSLFEGRGIGSALLEAVREAAHSAGCKRLWLITTNDNLHALGFYQKRGFNLAAIHRNALEESRRLKPEIPLFGRNGIPRRDEVELELRL